MGRGGRFLVGGVVVFSLLSFGYQRANTQAGDLAGPQVQPKVLVYCTEDGSGYVYNKTWFDEDLPAILSEHGYSPTVTDRQTVGQITSSLLSGYDELWIISSRPGSPGCFQSAEVSAITTFRDGGHGLLIAADHQDVNLNFLADANQLSQSLGVTFSGEVSQGTQGGEIWPTFTSHRLFSGVESTVGHINVANMSVSTPVTVIATYQGNNLIAALDDGKGRVVFDVTFTRFWDHQVHAGSDWILVGDTPQYVKNLADWLYRKEQRNFPVPSVTPYGMLALMLLMLLAGLWIIRRQRVNAVAA